MPEINFPRGACYGCGLFASKDHSPEGDIEPPTNIKVVPWADRIAGDLLSGEVPFCYAGRSLTYEDDFDTRSPRPLPTPISQELYEEKNCSSWVEYNRNFGLDWHLERGEVEHLEEDRRAWETRLDQSNKEFLKGLEDERRAWEKQSSKWPNRLIYAAILLAGAEVVGNAPYIQRLLGLD